MSTERLTSIPGSIIAGDTVAITLSLAGYDAPTWSVSWALAGVDTLEVSSTANGSAHDLDATSAETAALGAGLYQWRLRATDGTTVTTVQTGTLTVAADLAEMAPGDAVTWAASTLAIVESALAGTLESEMQQYMIGTRQVQSFSPDELWTIRSRLRAEVQREANGGVLPSVFVGRWPRSTDAMWAPT